MTVVVAYDNNKETDRMARKTRPVSWIKAALKADTISLLAFEIGMFAFMAVSSQLLFHPKLEPNQPAYWYMMQIAMLIGFVTAYPANWWLIRKGVKEAM